MRRLLLAMLLVPSLAFAKEESTAAASENPMSRWVPPKVKNEAKDKQEIHALIRSMDAASRTGDIEAAAALVDFPVMMATDDSKGEAKSEAWDRDRWVQMMKPLYENPIKDMKVTHKPTIFLLSDSLATVDDIATMTMGGKTLTTRQAALLVRRDDKWRIKAMAEGGWGDMMGERPGSASSTQEPPSQGTGSAAEGTGSQEAPSGAPARPESTTK